MSELIDFADEGIIKGIIYNLRSSPSCEEELVEEAAGALEYFLNSPKNPEVGKEELKFTYCPHLNAEKGNYVKEAFPLEENLILCVCFGCWSVIQEVVLSKYREIRVMMK